MSRMYPNGREQHAGEFAREFRIVLRAAAERVPTHGLRDAEPEQILLEARRLVLRHRAAAGAGPRGARVGRLAKTLRDSVRQRHHLFRLHVGKAISRVKC